MNFPVFIPYHSNGGNLNPKALLSLYLTFLFTFFICWIVRYFLINKNEHFGNQSKIKNFFYDIALFKSGKPDLNEITIIFFIVNGLALFFFVFIIILSFFE